MLGQALRDLREWVDLCFFSMKVRSAFGHMTRICQFLAKLLAHLSFLLTTMSSPKPPEIVAALVKRMQDRDRDETHNRSVVSPSNYSKPDLH